MFCGCFWPNLTSKIQSKNKRVESSLIACLDPGSIPGDSTKVFLRLKTSKFNYLEVFYWVQFSIIKVNSFSTLILNLLYTIKHKNGSVNSSVSILRCQ